MSDSVNTKLLLSGHGSDVSYSDLLAFLNPPASRAYEVQGTPSDELAGYLFRLVRSLLLGRSFLLDDLLNDVEVPIVPVTNLLNGDLQSLPKRILASKSSVGIATSGTSGTPKVAYHSIGILTRQVQVSPKHDRDVWGMAYSPARFAAVQVLLQGLCNLNTFVPLYNLSPAETSIAIQSNGVTHLSATPTFLRLLCSAGDRLTGVQAVTTGGEVVPSELRERVATTFPNARFRNVYASTEAGALFHGESDRFKVPRNLSSLVRVQGGELWIHRSLVSESLRDSLIDDFYRTGDLVEIIEDSPLEIRFVGRTSEWINVGGSKVNPQEVEECLLSYSAIEDARVFPQKNSVCGQLVAAEIVLKPGALLTVAEVRQMLQGKLAPHAIPRIIRFVDVISQINQAKKVRTE